MITFFSSVGSHWLTIEKQLNSKLFCELHCKLIAELFILCVCSFPLNIVCPCDCGSLVHLWPHMDQVMQTCECFQIWMFSGRSLSLSFQQGQNMSCQVTGSPRKKEGIDKSLALEALGQGKKFTVRFINVHPSACWLTCKSDITNSFHSILCAKVAVEGNIGSGKSTLLNYLKDDPLVEVRKELVVGLINITQCNGEWINVSHAGTSRTSWQMDRYTWKQCTGNHRMMKCNITI